MKHIQLLTLLALFALGTPFAPQAQSWHENIAFEHLGTEDGLSRSNVKVFAQDGNGFIWVGTQYGLNRYNGYSFDVYLNSPDDSLCSIVNNEIRSLMTDRAGNLWVGTRSGGFHKYSPDQNCFIRFGQNEEQLRNAEVDDLMEDQQGFIWISTTNGILRFDPNEETFLSILPSPESEQGLPNRYVKQVFQDKAGRYWVAHDRGISQMFVDKGEDIRFENHLFSPSNADGLPSKYVKRIIEDSDGRLWVASDGGVSVFDRSTLKFKSFSHNPEQAGTLSNNYVKAIALDQNGRLWVGADAGVSIYDEKIGGFHNYSHQEDDPKSLSNNYVKGLFSDRDGAMWIGTDAGISRFDANQYPFGQLFARNASRKNTLSSSCVYAVLEAGDGWLWLATNKGINKLHPKTGTVRSYGKNAEIEQGGLPSLTVKALLLDRKGTLWVGTDNGLCELIKETPDRLYFKTYQHDPKNPHESLSNNSVVGLDEDREGNIWIATFGNGISRYHPKSGQFSSMTTELSINGALLSNNQVQFVKIDQNNTLWIGNGSLDTLNLNTFSIGRLRDSEAFSRLIEDTNPYCWAESADGQSIFMGAGTGIIKYNRVAQSYSGITTKQGLGSNSVRAIEVDSRGLLWISTDRGITRHNPSDQTSHSFDGSDGLQPSEFNIMSSYQNQQGIMYFGGLKGLNIFNPLKLQLNERKPPVYITGLYLKNQEVTPQNSDILTEGITNTPHIVLDHDDTFLKLTFVALNYRNPHKNQYAYKLEGLQEEWVEVSADRRDATFSSLPPKEYTFRIKASNNDGLWNKEGASLKITVTPPWWQQPIVQALAILLLILGVYIFIRVRTNMLEAQKKQLELQVKERTEEILVQNEELQQQSEEITSQRDRIEEQHKALEASYNDIKVVSEVGKDITGSFSIEKIFDEVYKDVNLIMDAPTFAIGLYQEAEQSLEFMGVDEAGQAIQTSTDYLEQTHLFSVRCFQSGEPVLISNFRKEFPEYDHDSIESGIINESILYLPLEAKNKKLGVITVQSRKANAYEPRHRTMLEILASYAATALENREAYELIHTKNQQITDSIRYAKTIQEAILPSEQRMTEAFSEHFVLFRPKDIVSGDFYWHMTVRDSSGNPQEFVACVDCTGHGVPGAFMSMIASRILTEVLIEKGLREPSEILELLDLSVRTALKQEGGQHQGNIDSDNTDGMDLSLCRIDYIEEGMAKVTFAGAKNDLFYIPAKGDKSVRLMGNKRSIGGIQLRKSAFEQEQVELPKGSSIYLGTDGYADQHGADRKKLGRQKLIEIVEGIQHLPLAEQKSILENELDRHQGEMEQRDDITIIGLKL